MNDDEQRALLRSAQQVQNIQSKMTLGLIAGGILGLIVGAWVVMPYYFADNAGMGFIVTCVLIVVMAIAGQRLVLNALAR